MKRSYAIPNNCKKVTVEAAKGVLTISFEPIDTMEFYSDITGDIEEQAKKGDLAILYNKEEPQSAIIAKLADYELSDGIKYYAANGVAYNSAMRFRCQEQYDSIITYEQ